MAKRAAGKPLIPNRLTLGIDEAGRGPTIGPLVMAAVAIDSKVAAVWPKAEEFGFPRDMMSLARGSSVSQRDKYFGGILGTDFVLGNLVGLNFWAFGGIPRPINGQPFWKTGDDRMGDPPMEEQGLNSVFESDKSTWKVIDGVTKKLKKR